uniref:AIG1-type G domain-containing protein n=1 Tax=Astyanax mexicanus TaxID=7994 RepID=A0A3B1IF20_ASTMX
MLCCKTLINQKITFCVFGTDTEHLGKRRKSITLPPSMSELRVVLLGKNSSEISRVGNFILGRDAFNTDAPPPSVEQHSEKDGGTVEGRNITLINSPHLFQPQLSEEELNQRVRECMTLCSPGPHVLVLVLQPDDFTEKDLDRLHSIFQSLSKDPHKHTLVLKTENKDDGTVDSDQEIIVQNIIAECSNRCLELRGSSSAVVKMMEEMFSKNGGQYLICEEFEDAPLVKPQKERTEQEFGQADLHKRSPRLNLIVCGNDGSVKSSVSDLILGQKKLSADSSSVCVRREAEVCGHLISLVELPALCSSQLSEEEGMPGDSRCLVSLL